MVVGEAADVMRACAASVGRMMACVRAVVREIPDRQLSGIYASIPLTATVNPPCAGRG